MPKNAPAQKIAGLPTTLVALADMAIDNAYQRLRIDKHVNSIISHFDPLRLTPIILSRRQGRRELFILDGQQRYNALSVIGYTHAHAVVIDVANEVEEARLFAQLNQDGKKLKISDLHKANIAMGEPVALAIEQCLQLYGYTAKPTTMGKGVTAIAALRSAWGDLGNKKDATLTAPQLAQGRKTLEWALAAGSPMIKYGDSANKTFSEKNLRALIWVYRTAMGTPDLKEVQRAMDMQPDYITGILTNNVRNGGGRLNTVWGARLARHVNASRNKDVIALPQEAWDGLANYEKGDYGPQIKP